MCFFSLFLADTFLTSQLKIFFIGIMPDRHYDLSYMVNYFLSVFRGQL